MRILIICHLLLSDIWMIAIIHLNMCNTLLLFAFASILLFYIGAPSLHVSLSLSVCLLFCFFCVSFSPFLWLATEAQQSNTVYKELLYCFNPAAPNTLQVVKKTHPLCWIIPSTVKSQSHLARLTLSPKSPWLGHDTAALLSFDPWDWDICTTGSLMAVDIITHPLTACNTHLTVFEPSVNRHAQNEHRGSQTLRWEFVYLF